MKPIRTFTGCALATVLLTGCVLPGALPPSPTVDADSILTAAAGTAFARLTEIVLLASPTAATTLTETPLPSATVFSLPTSIPMIEPLPGVVSANANVRGVPAKSKAHDLGGLLFGNPVQVIGRSVDATWLYILYADSPTGTGWVTARAITMEAEMGILPILIYPNGEEAQPIMLPPYIYKVTGTPQAPAPPPADWSKYGTLTQPAFVRIGPSVGFLSMGVLEPGVKVTFRGRIDGNTWVQIDYPSGPDEKGWILSQLAQANDGYGRLPYFDLLGTPVTSSPEGAPATQAGDVANATTASAVGAPNPTATPAAPASAGAQGEVTAQINVRNGPAQSFRSLGLLNPKDKVSITGRTLNGLWYKIVFSQSTEGLGWVSSQYVKVTGDMRSLPYYNDQATLIP